MPPSRGHRPDPRLVLRALTLLRRASAATHEWQRSEIDRGFTFNQGLVLHYLVVHGDASPSDLASWMQVSRGSVTPIIHRLEKLGLLTRQSHERDGRRQWLVATKQAHDLAPSLEDEVMRPVLKAFAKWPSNELERFCDGLDRVLRSEFLRGRT